MTSRWRMRTHLSYGSPRGWSEGFRRSNPDDGLCRLRQYLINGIKIYLGRRVSTLSGLRNYAWGFQSRRVATLLSSRQPRR